MSVLVSIFATLAGLVFGSFLNVCISRLPRHESIVSPRSRCPGCRKPILSRDNIPLLSWLVLKGRCRNCGVPIPLRYPLIEAATAALFLLCFLKFDLTLLGVGAAVLCWLFLGLAATDAETLLLPDALTLPGIVLGVFYRGLSGSSGLFSWKEATMAIVWAACAAGLILLIRGLYRLVRRREGLGLGDAKLLAMIAAWLGPSQTVLVLFLGVVSAGLYGAAVISLRNRRQEQEASTLLTRIPLGAFLSAAGIVAVFRGGSILNWYLSFFR